LYGARQLGRPFASPGKHRGIGVNAHQVKPERIMRQIQTGADADFQHPPARLREHFGAQRAQP
jgi:hypothetical protein